MTDNKLKIIAIMGQSGSGKSTLTSSLLYNYLQKFHFVKSFTTRPIRENDPNDINTHIFVNEDKYDKDKHEGRILAFYQNPQGYKYWTTEESFDKDKINLYAIDSKAFVDFYFWNKDKYDIKGAYIFTSIDTKIQNLIKRGENPSKYGPDELHLSAKHILHAIFSKGDVKGFNNNKTIDYLRKDFYYNFKLFIEGE